MRLTLPVLLFVLLPFTLLSQLKSPQDFFPHPYGQQFTPHHLLVDYTEHVAKESPLAQLTYYGRTNENRPLLLLFISTPENLAQLDAIRTNNLKKTGLIEGDSDPALDRAIVWLSFGVHGNEAAASESSITAMYDLTNPNNAQTKEWLKNTIIIIDPCLNPDGYSRYTHWYRNAANKIPNLNVDSREHREPWPGGRVNHYLFDLNRDWAWQTQIESQQRIKVYQQWMPQIHVDFHEQGYNSPYYFAPAAVPFHEYITPWQSDFQTLVGKNHARYFDAQGWLYFTKEFFDLFYPSYGDTYPTFNGAIGMTYEQGGHSQAGRAIFLENGDTLYLQDRIDHHKTTALSTIEVASQNAADLISNFEAYFKKSVETPPGEYITYVVKASNAKGKLQALCEFLDKNLIQYGQSNEQKTIKGFDYQNRIAANVQVENGDLIISAQQPLSVLTQVLMDPSSELQDSLTYDITAWALPYVYGLETYAVKQAVEMTAGFDFKGREKSGIPKAYAYLIPWESMKEAQFLSTLIQYGFTVRFASQPLSIEGKAYQAGTLVILKADNYNKQSQFDIELNALATKEGIAPQAVQTGFSDKGPDLGSSSIRLVRQPTIALLFGENVSSNSFGQLWHFLEDDLRYPVHVVDADNLSADALSAYDVVLMPEGRYKINDNQANEINKWVSGGGALIAIGQALRSLKDKPGFKLLTHASEQEQKEAKKQREQAALDKRTNNYGGRQRRQISSFIPGAIVKVKMDPTHPLSFGMEDYYFSLKTNNQNYPLLKNAWNVGILEENLVVSGFVGYKLKEQLKNTLVFGVEEKRNGAIVYMVDNPLFRSFWENGKFLLSNALFFVGQ